MKKSPQNIITIIVVAILLVFAYLLISVGTYETTAQAFLSMLPDPDIVWSGDAETGDLSQWCEVNEAVLGRITVVDNPVAQGNYSYRFQLNNGDSIFGSERVTLSQQCDGRYELDGEEKYYGWSVMLPNDYPYNTSWSLVVQWKGIHTGSPPIQLSQRDANWQLTYRPTASSSNIVKWKAPVNKGQYDNFVMHVKWSSDPTIGFIELWYNGQLVVEKFYTSTIHLSGGLPVENYVAMGLYRDSAISTDVILYHDGFTVGKTFASVTGEQSPAVDTPTNTLAIATDTSTPTETPTPTPTLTPSVTPSVTPTSSPTSSPTPTLWCPVDPAGMIYICVRPIK